MPLLLVHIIILLWILHARAVENSAWLVPVRVLDLNPGPLSTSASSIAMWGPGLKDPPPGPRTAALR